ncbi:MAG: RNA methyltransferase [Burkholderiaceae bacterium]|nr:RNA methyltransferase [Burkholderiaceae bacterium]
MIAPMEDFRPIQPLLARIRFVLIAPTHPGNVGASARALQAMGFRELWLVDPEDQKIAQRAEAVALSSGAAQVLGDARVATLDQALAPTTWSCALSARAREFEPPRLSLEQACEELLSHLDGDATASAAFVFGQERSGLTNDQVLSCRRVCSLDVEEKFSSLNLSQAVQVVAYAMRRAARSGKVSGTVSDTSARPRIGNNRETARPASHDAVMGLHDHLVRVAIKVGYLDPAVPGRFEERLKRLLARKEMWEDEVQMLRGLCTEIERRS